jgi:hypothetical protein
MEGLHQALLALGFIVIVFLAGYGARAARSKIRRWRGARRRGAHGRLFYAGRRISAPEAAELTDMTPTPSTFDGERLAADLNRFGECLSALRTVYAEQHALSRTARADLASATELFRASLEQTQALTTALADRLDAAQRLQFEFEEMISRLRKRAKDGTTEAVLPFKVRHKRMSEQK